MKNLFTLLIALLFTAGMAYAQVNQNTIVQTGAGAHDATVTQTWTSGAANQVFINQAGDATLTGGDHAASATQYGGGNTADIDQLGENNAATTNQNGQDNYVQVLQNGDAFAPTNVAVTVTQSKDRNSAFVNQTAGESNTGTIVQDGYDNVAYLTQGRNQGFAYITQTGGSNYAQVEQYAVANNTSTANIHQTNDWGGDGHDARQYMGEAVYPMNGSNQMEIIQNGGDRNYAEQRMLSSLPNPPFNDSNNRQRIWQSGGTDNAAYQTLGRAPETEMDSNDALAEQVGTGNFSDQDQLGVSSTTEVHQLGDWNQSWTTQTGPSNSATLFQHNDNNWSSISQTGNQHTATVHQYGN